MAHHKSKGKTAKAATRTPPEEDPEFQIAPMIDILLVLLVFFMSISSTEALQSNKEIQLAVAKDAKGAKKTNNGQVIINVLWVAMNNLGTIKVDDVTYPLPGDLVPKLQTEFKNKPGVRVLVRIDRGTRWEYEREVLRAIGQAGITDVTFSVVDKPSGGEAPAAK